MPEDLMRSDAEHLARESESSLVDGPKPANRGARSADFFHHDPSEPDLALRNLQSAQPKIAALYLVYAGLTVAQLWEEPVAAWSAALAGLAAAAVTFHFARSIKVELPLRDREGRLATVAALFGIVVSSLYLGLTASPGHTAILVAILLTTCRALPSVSIAAGLSALTIALWSTAAVLQGSPEWLAYGLGLLAAIALSGFLQAARLTRLERDRRKPKQPGLTPSAINVYGDLEGLWEWDVDDDCIRFSRHWMAMLGYGADDRKRSMEDWLWLVHPEDRNRLVGQLRMLLDGKAIACEVEHRIRHADESFHWVLVHARILEATASRPRRLVGSQLDIRRLKSFEDQLHHNASHDRLTGLPNRDSLIQKVQSEIDRGQAHPGYRFAVAFMDLDGFKAINDSLGHMAGDRLLAEVGRRLEEIRLESDLVARIGGDEFVLLMRSLRNEYDARSRVLMVQQSLEKPYVIDGTELFSSASIGVAFGPSGLGGAPSELLRNADIAMYQAKADGRTGPRIFNSEMHIKASKRWSLQNDLRRALERNELALHYQPIVELEAGRIVAAETLLRWYRGGEEMISPAVFIPMAEELGLIREIGRWVLVETCRQNRTWQDAGLRPIKTSVNLSARQLNHPAFAETVRAILAETKLEPQHLQLELTETALMGGSDATPASLKRLFEMGVVMAIDDFGTGYSSLDYLRRLPFDVLKIDTSFVADIPADSRAAALAQSIVSMAHSLQLEVVGEGVETLAQLEFLRGIGCDQVQGYLASRPRPVHEMTALLDHDTRLLELAGAEIANHSARALSDATSLRHTPSVH